MNTVSALSHGLKFLNHGSAPSREEVRASVALGANLFSRQFAMLNRRQAASSWPSAATRLHLEILTATCRRQVMLILPGLEGEGGYGGITLYNYIQ
jgi:hypothetical protein